MLRLRPGLYIPEAFMKLISQGELLPLLEMLEVASCTGVDILTMVKERNEVAYHRGGFIGSSSAAPSVYRYPVPPTFLAEVVFWTSMRQIRLVTRRVEFIQAFSSLQKTRLRILYVDQEFLI